MKTTEIPMNADHVQAGPDLQREVAFAKSCLDVEDPMSVFWLAALYARVAREEEDDGS